MCQETPYHPLNRLEVGQKRNNRVPETVPSDVQEVLQFTEQKLKHITKNGLKISIEMLHNKG